jgi:hypothetical protein
MPQGEQKDTNSWEIQFIIPPKDQGSRTQTVEKYSSSSCLKARAELFKTTKTTLSLMVSLNIETQRRPRRVGGGQSQSKAAVLSCNHSDNMVMGVYIHIRIRQDQSISYCWDHGIPMGWLILCGASDRWLLQWHFFYCQCVSIILPFFFFSVRSCLEELLSKEYYNVVGDCHWHS